MPPPTRPAPTRPGQRPQSIVTAPAPTIDFSPRKPEQRPFRMLFYAVEGWGKTTLGAYSKNPFMLMGQGETGYDTLLASGRVPAIPGRRVERFGEALQVLDLIAANRSDRETLVVDSMSTFEDMLFEEVCKEHFGGDWGPQGFQSYGKGYGIASTEWLKLIGRLDRLHQLGCNIIMLSHATTTSFKNPLGADFKRYTPDLYDSEKASILGPTKAFADMILFGNFEAVVEVAKSEAKKNVAERKGKGIGDTNRVIYAERRDAFDAKNRYGMSPQFDIGDDFSQTWETVWNEITGASRQ